VAEPVLELTRLKLAFHNFDRLFSVSYLESSALHKNKARNVDVDLISDEPDCWNDGLEGFRQLEVYSVHNLLDLLFFVSSPSVFGILKLFVLVLLAENTNDYIS